MESPKKIWERISATLVNEKALSVEQGTLEHYHAPLDYVESKGWRLHLISGENHFYQFRRKEETSKHWRKYKQKLKRYVKEHPTKPVGIMYRREVIGLEKLLLEFMPWKKIKLPGVYNHIITLSYDNSEQ